LKPNITLNRANRMGTPTEDEQLLRKPEPTPSDFTRSDTWRVLRIMGEFVQGFDTLADVVEEHFDAGWDNWVGGVSDWKVDVAGVRAGSLALYSPTLDLSDYELEFLARIDTRTVNWVVRAAGLDQYVRCTLTVAGEFVTEPWALEITTS
jgi:hypothetical protein